MPSVMLKNITILFVGFLVLCIATNSSCETGDLEDATLEAFGGYINIPHYMQLVVQKYSDDSYAIRMVKKLDAEGGVDAIIIKRPSEPYKSSSGNLILVESFVVNRFTVDLYEANKSMLDTNLLSASVTRCSETGQFFVRSKAQLEQYLMRASSEECGYLSPDLVGKEKKTERESN